MRSWTGGPEEPFEWWGVRSADRSVTVEGVDAMTVRTMYILSRKPGMSFEEFRTHWRDVHMPLAAQVPGIVKYVRRLVVPEGGADEPDNE